MAKNISIITMVVVAILLMICVCSHVFLGRDLVSVWGIVVLCAVDTVAVFIGDYYLKREEY